MTTPNWKIESGAWHAIIHDAKSYDFFVEPTKDHQWAFRYHGPDGMSPTSTDFNDYTFAEADDAKDAVLKHYTWLGDDDPHRFDEWYEEYRQYKEN